MSILGEQFLHVLVDSKRRQTGTTSNFTFKIDFPADQQYNRVLVQQVLISQTFYLFQDGTNTFVLSVGGVQYPITIPVGNYTNTTFAAVIGQLLTQTNDKKYSYTCVRARVHIQMVLPEQARINMYLASALRRLRLSHSFSRALSRQKLWALIQQYRRLYLTTDFSTHPFVTT